MTECPARSDPPEPIRDPGHHLIQQIPPSGQVNASSHACRLADQRRSGEPYGSWSGVGLVSQVTVRLRGAPAEVAPRGEPDVAGPGEGGRPASTGVPPDTQRDKPLDLRLVAELRNIMRPRLQPSVLSAFRTGQL